MVDMDFFFFRKLEEERGVTYTYVDNRKMKRNSCLEWMCAEGMQEDCCDAETSFGYLLGKGGKRHISEQ